MEIVEKLFAQYGYFVLLFGLPLELIASPIPPGNTTLAYTGYLTYKHVLALPLALMIAYVGTLLGITTTYWIGRRLGMPVIEKYGKWLFIKRRHLMKTKRAYQKFGNKVLIFGFFLPGVRQFNGYFAGIMQIPFRTFALYASIGSGLWVSAFIGIGYAFGNQWKFVFHWIEQFFLFILILLCVAIVVFLLFKRRSRKMARFT